MTAGDILKLFLLSISLVSCTAGQRSTGESANDSILRGYDTRHRGSLRFMVDGRRVSGIETPAGRQSLQIEADSEPEIPDDFSSDPSYQCYYRSWHNLNFQSQPGKTYRLHLDQSEPKQYLISVHEEIDDAGPMTKPVQAASQQTKVVRRCGFIMGF